MSQFGTFQAANGRLNEGLVGHEQRFFKFDIVVSWSRERRPFPTTSNTTLLCRIRINIAMILSFRSSDKTCTCSSFNLVISYFQVLLTRICTSFSESSHFKMAAPPGRVRRTTGSGTTTDPLVGTALPSRFGLFETHVLTSTFRSCGWCFLPQMSNDLSEMRKLPETLVASGIQISGFGKMTLMLPNLYHNCF